jgi:hypothetical protein
MPFEMAVCGAVLFAVLSVVAALRRNYELFLKAIAGVGLEYAILGGLFGDPASGPGAMLFLICLTLIRRNRRSPVFS